MLGLRKTALRCWEDKGQNILYLNSAQSFVENNGITVWNNGGGEDITPLLRKASREYSSPLAMDKAGQHAKVRKALVHCKMDERNPLV